MDLGKPKIMGIINLTGDSFYGPSRIEAEEELGQRIADFIAQGADVLDLGAQSTRPGAKALTAMQEADRLLPALAWLRAHYPDFPVSIDTFQTEVLRQALVYGPNLVNDISAGSLDQGFLELVADSGLPYVLMHMRGRPQTMQLNTNYDDIILEMSDFFLEKLALLRNLGIKNVILDLGLGFAKSLEDNYRVLQALPHFKTLFELPILVGLSRKSMIYKYLGLSPETCLEASSALHLQALNLGANMLRVHDPREACQMRSLYEILQANQPF